MAIVTGGASGIGAALGGALVRRGCAVVLADIDADGARRAAERLSAAGPGVAVAACVDVCDPDAVSSLVRDAVAEHGRLDLLFNNAGIGVGGPVEELLLVHWQRTLEVNLYGVIHGVMAAYPLMLRQGYGHIVNTASMAGLVPAPLMAPYATSKFGVVGLSLALRAEAARHGVRVSVVCPGVIDTPILDKREQAGLPVPPSVQHVDPRAWLTRLGGPAYPPQRLAEDVLRGVAANRAIIVAPASARLAWRLWRWMPGLMLRETIRRFERERRVWGGG
jgi:NAD(P)-dependent dehydrogenase (short-subunit alcohol dehydrogenase family)